MREPRDEPAASDKDRGDASDGQADSALSAAPATSTTAVLPRAPGGAVGSRSPPCGLHRRMAHVRRDLASVADVARAATRVIVALVGLALAVGALLAALHAIGLPVASPASSALTAAADAACSVGVKSICR